MLTSSSAAVSSICSAGWPPFTMICTLGTGEFYLGVEALESGLIDATGDLETASQWLKQELNLTNINFAEYKKETTILDIFSGILGPQSYLIGKGIGSELKNTQAKFEILA